MDKDQKSIGYIVGGGLKENLRVRLTIPSQAVQEGAFVVIESGNWQFYGSGDRPAAWLHRPTLCG